MKRWLAMIVLLVAGALVAPQSVAAAGAAGATAQRPELPRACAVSLGGHLQLREEQRDGSGKVVASAGPGSAPLQYQPDATGRYTPVLLVHGFTAGAGYLTDGWPKTGTFDTPITLNAGPGSFRGLPRSLVGQLQAIRGAAVFELDYHDRNTDIAMLPDSATARATGQRTITCVYQYDASPLGVAAAVRSVVNSPCMHTNLMAEVTLTNEAVAEVADAIASPQPPADEAAGWLIGSWSGDVFQHNLNRTYSVQLDFWADRSGPSWAGSPTRRSGVAAT
jgi:hypothetical protein